MNKKDYSIFFLKEWSTFLKEFKKKVQEDARLVKIVQSETNLIKVEDLDSNFFFTVFKPTQTSDNKVTAEISKSPRNHLNNKAHNITAEVKNIIPTYQKWLALIHDYENISFSEEDEITKQYEEEFSTEFDIVDEDADTKAFDMQKQLLLLEYLNIIEGAIEKLASEEHKEALLIETKQLKIDLPLLTKRATIKKLSSLLAKVRKKGLVILKEIWAESKKEVIKRALNMGSTI